MYLFLIRMTKIPHRDIPHRDDMPICDLNIIQSYLRTRHVPM